MKLYTYHIRYDNHDETLVKDCKNPFEWEKLTPTCLYRFDTPEGSQLINMNHVVSIWETINELDPNLEEAKRIGNALTRHNFDCKSAAEELGMSERTLYRKAKQHNLNVH